MSCLLITTLTRFTVLLSLDCFIFTERIEGIQKQRKEEKEKAEAEAKAKEEESKLKDADEKNKEDGNLAQEKTTDICESTEGKC